jgi:hypothetical protein
VTFSSTFTTLELASFSDLTFKSTFETSYKSAVASAAGVTVNQVEILSIKAGSVVVDSAILVTDEAAGSAIASQLQSSTTTLSTALSASYGAVTVSAPAVQSIRSPPPPSTPPVFSATDSGGAASGTVLLTFVVAGVALLLY